MKRQTRYMKPTWNCYNCKGLGLQYFADSFDRDNGTPCPACKRRAKERGMKLLLPYTR